MLKPARLLALQLTLVLTLLVKTGAVGSVSGYEIRRVVKADPNALDVTQDEWDAAGATSYIYDESRGYDATTAPGDRVTIRIQGDGQYSRPNGHGLLQLGLTPNKIHTVAIKALDDAVDDTGEQIRNAPIADIDVDLTWSQQTIAFTNANGDVPLTSGGLYAGKPLTAAGDVNGDGFDDVLVTFTKYNYTTFTFQSVTQLILGNDDPAAVSTLELTVPTGAPNVIRATGGGDLNGDGAKDFAVVGFSDADYTTSVVAIYFGCSDPATCDDTELSTPDAEISHNPGEFSAFDGVHMVGEYYRRNTDTQVYDDLFVGGNGFAEFGGTDQQAYVIAGRSTADWEASGSFVINANGDAAAGIANVGNGVLTIKSPANTAIPGRSAVVINTNTDASGNAYSQLVISAHSNPATALPQFVFVAQGGPETTVRRLYNKPRHRRYYRCPRAQRL